jgi:hypothetical protein
MNKNKLNEEENKPETLKSALSMNSPRLLSVCVCVKASERERILNYSLWTFSSIKRGFR